MISPTRGNSTQVSLFACFRIAFEDQGHPWTKYLCAVSEQQMPRAVLAECSFKLTRPTADAALIPNHTIKESCFHANPSNHFHAVLSLKLP
jgi:hypothetical protein